MQATANTTTRQFGFNRFRTTMMTLGLTAAIAIGAAGAAITDSLPSVGSSEGAIVLPKAHNSAGQGEGLIAGTFDIGPAVRAYTSERQGDGLLGGNLAVAAQPQAHMSLSQGEGILGGLGSTAALNLPVKAYDHAGMGEGWATNGRQDNILKAYAVEGQGEGWVGQNR
ncbi:MAG TPA: hypothetical protein VEX37_16540 [Thermomicrobiales bacterium]|nr:hypothetical protein [Thermomicrobiales bacterium]